MIMGRLRQRFKRIDKLARDLSSVVVVQEEKSHEECLSTAGTPGCHSYTDVDPPNYCQGHILVVDQKRITEPNTERQRKASDKLQSIVDSNKPEIIKYAAARALGQEPETCFGIYPVTVWAIKHPIAAIVTGAALALGLSYFTYNLLK